MPDPLVVVVMREHKARLLALEQAQMVTMARRWLTVEDALEAAIINLADQIADLQAAGETVSPSRIFQLGRYRSLLAQAEREVKRYVNYADELIADTQADWGLLALDQSVEAITASYVGAGVVPAAFDILPVGAIEDMIGLAGDGSPLKKLLDKSWPEAAQGLTNELIRATAIGQNPRETARRMQDGLTHGLNRMLNIARSEQLRVYREAGRQNYQESGVVSGYKRLAAHDDRVCPACLFADGRHYELDEPLDEHASGRCAQVPEVKGLPAVTWKNGLSWFADQDASTQRSILGPGRYDAWQDGAFKLGDLVSEREDDTWGSSLQPTPLKELVG